MFTKMNLVQSQIWLTNKHKIRIRNYIISHFIGQTKFMGQLVTIVQNLHFMINNHLKFLILHVIDWDTTIKKTSMNVAPLASIMLLYILTSIHRSNSNRSVKEIKSFLTIVQQIIFLGLYLARHHERYYKHARLAFLSKCKAMKMEKLVPFFFQWLSGSIL